MLTSDQSDVVQMRRVSRVTVCCSAAVKSLEHGCLCRVQDTIGVMGFLFLSFLFLNVRSMSFFLTLSLFIPSQCCQDAEVQTEPMADTREVRSSETVLTGTPPLSGSDIFIALRHIDNVAAGGQVEAPPSLPVLSLAVHAKEESEEDVPTELPDFSCVVENGANASEKTLESLEET